MFIFEDLETEELVTIDNRKNNLNVRHMKDVPKRNLITISTDEDYVKKLKGFFVRRGMR